MKALILAAGISLLSGAAMATPTETLNVSFLTPDAAVTTDKYTGLIDITVSGVGQSDATNYNDAFYVYTGVTSPSATLDSTYYQLALSTSALYVDDAASAASKHVVGGIPAYSASHEYSFEYDLGAITPSTLHFGVTDGKFSDNSGAFTVAVSEVVAAPEPFSMALLGSGLVGLTALRRRRSA